MLDSKGFDLWADQYDGYVIASDEDNTYPFAGYRKVIETVFATIMQKENAVVLDLGFGTGTLTSALYRNGCTVFGQDYSERMIELASEKMPDAHLYKGDFAEGLAEPLKKQKYDYIIATYAMHHLTDEQKIDLLHTLFKYLNEDGKIIVGDIVFETREEMNACMEQAGDEWDDEEIYFVTDDFRKAFPELHYEKISFCAGVITFSKETEDIETKNTPDLITDGILAYGVTVGRFEFSKGKKTVYAITDLLHVGPSDATMVYQISKKDHDWLLRFSQPDRLPDPPYPSELTENYHSHFLCGESAYCKRNRFSLKDADPSLLVENR